MCGTRLGLVCEVSCNLREYLVNRFIICKTVMCKVWHIPKFQCLIERWLDYQLPYVEVVCCSDRLLSVCIIGHPKCHLTRVECRLLIIVDVGTIAHSYSLQVSVYPQIACKRGKQLESVSFFRHSHLVDWLGGLCSIHDLSVFYFALV